MNVLFIISDDLSAEALGCYGNKQSITPHIDKLADSGTLFNRAYCQFPVCGAARAALMSGLYAPTINVMGNGGSSRFTQNLGKHKTWSQYFIHNNYYAARVGKIYHMRVPGDITAGVHGPDHADSWVDRFSMQGPEWMSYGRHEHLTNQRLHFNPTGHYNLGFGSAFYVVEGHTNGEEQPDLIATTKAIEIMESKKDSPFFLAVGFVRPHVPLVAPKKYFDMYETEVLNVPKVPDGDWDDIPKPGISHNSKGNGLYGKYHQKQKVLQAYYASTTFMDDQVGRLMNALDRLELTDNTLVIFTSDHGYHLGEHDFWQKVSLHEESVRVPLIVSGPGVQKQINNTLSQHIDLYPTVASMSNLSIPKRCQGNDLSSILTKKTYINREFVHSCTGKGHLLRSDQYAFMKYNSGEVELYDMKKDPKQFQNLAKNPNSNNQLVIAQFEERLKNFIGEIK